LLTGESTNYEKVKRSVIDAGHVLRERARGTRGEVTPKGGQGVLAAPEDRDRDEKRSLIPAVSISGTE